MLYIIIPNFNGVEHLKTCFPSLFVQSFQDFKVILIDNGSTDESVIYTQNNFPQIHIIKLGYNTGFAKAVNEGIKLSLRDSKTNFILLLNNDIELDNEFLHAGIDTFVNNNEASFIAAKMLNYYERDQIDDCGDSIRAFGRIPFARGYGEKDVGQYDKGEFIFGASAGAGFYRKEIFEKAGLFDETFFAYYEDIDLSFRAQLLGFKCYYQPKAVCYHKRGGTTSVATHGFQTEQCERNLVLMRIKNYPLCLYILYQPIFFIARIVRYYRFLRDHSLLIFLHALKGYIRGTLLLIFQLPKRFEIQRNKIISTKKVRSLFSK